VTTQSRTNIEAHSPALDDTVHQAARRKRKPFFHFVAQLQQSSVSVALSTVSIGALLLLWYLATKFRLECYIRFTNVPTPYEVLQQALELGTSTKFIVNITTSLRRILLGFGLAAFWGTVLGLLIGSKQRAHELLMPALEVLRPIPAIAWVPMSVMLWPNNEASIVFITFLGAFFPILLNAVHGVQRVERVLINSARCLGASELQLFWHIILPGVMPSLFTGLAVGMGVAWVSLIAAEMISGQFGIGYFTWEAYSLVNYPGIVLGMLTIGVLGLLCSRAIKLVGQWTMPWLAYGGAKR